MRLSNEQWAQAQLVCTQPQLDALDLWRKEFGYKRIAFVLHIQPSTAKARIEAALNKLDLSLHNYAA